MPLCPLPSCAHRRSPDDSSGTMLAIFAIILHLGGLCHEGSGLEREGPGRGEDHTCEPVTGSRWLCPQVVSGADSASIPLSSPACQPAARAPPSVAWMTPPGPAISFSRLGHRRPGVLSGSPQGDTVTSLSPPGGRPGPFLCTCATRAHSCPQHWGAVAGLSRGLFLRASLFIVGVEGAGGRSKPALLVHQPCDPA